MYHFKNQTVARVRGSTDRARSVQKTTEGQYSAVRLEQAMLVSMLYGTWAMLEFE